jgi:hypothetical protein
VSTYLVLLIESTVTFQSSQHCSCNPFLSNFFHGIFLAGSGLVESECLSFSFFSLSHMSWATKLGNQASIPMLTVATILAANLPA